MFHFGDFRLDVRRGLLHRETGEPVDLTPKGVALLTILVDHAGQTVEKRELLGALWPDVVVEESNLTQTIYVLRRALGEHPEDHRFIVTVPGRGYRFVAKVTPQAPTADGTAAPVAPVAPPPISEARAEPPATVSPAARSWWRPAALAAAVLVTVVATSFAAQEIRQRNAVLAKDVATPAAGTTNSIAVLPFTDLSPEQDRAWFADGLAEEILDVLASNRDLRVIARTSSFSFRGQNKDIASIARRLDVAHLLEGSVRVDGNTARITAQLIRASDSSHIWSHTFERELDDVFGVQSDIAAAVAERLEVKLAPAPARAVAAAGPRYSEAWQQYLRGQYFYGRREPGDIERSLAAYEAAVSADPSIGRAWAGIAAAVSLLVYDYGLPRDIGLPRIRDAALKAVALDPEWADGHVRLGRYYHLVGDGAAARRHFERANALDPDSPLVLGGRAGHAAEQGRIQEAVALQRRAAAVDPLTVVTVSNLANFLYYAGELEEARATVNAVNDLGRIPGNDGILGRILVLERNFEGALAVADAGDGTAEYEQIRALALHGLHRTREADASLQRLIQIAGDREALLVAEVLAYRSETDAAMQWLARATKPVDMHLGFVPGGWYLWEIQRSPLLAPLRADRRWADAARIRTAANVKASQAAM
jgi:TolB-like protein/DNA-binding winged helix-turn-helix (wHTH) protein